MNRDLFYSSRIPLTLPSGQHRQNCNIELRKQRRKIVNILWMNGVAKLGHTKNSALPTDKQRRTSAPLKSSASENWHSQYLQIASLN